MAAMADGDGSGDQTAMVAATAMVETAMAMVAAMVAAMVETAMAAKRRRINLPFYFIYLF